MKVTPRAVTGLVDALVADGLVTREPHPGDRRATLVTFTSSGQTLIAQLKQDHEALARALFAPMSRREFDGFARGLRGVIDRLRDHLVGPKQQEIIEPRSTRHDEGNRPRQLWLAGGPGTQGDRPAGS